jgi:hypothetical protein
MATISGQCFLAKLRFILYLLATLCFIRCQVGALDEHFWAISATLCFISGQETLNGTLLLLPVFLLESDVWYPDNLSVKTRHREDILGKYRNASTGLPP